MVTNENKIIINNNWLMIKVTGVLRIKIRTCEKNEFGELLKATTDDGQEVNYAYDSIGRQIEILYPNGTKIEYEYDKGKFKQFLLMCHNQSEITSTRESCRINKR